MAAQPWAPRRILVSTLLTVLLGSVTVAAVGAQDAEHPVGLPSTWSVPPPHQGDRAFYDYTLVDRTGKPVGSPVPFFAFEQRPARWDLDVQGEAVPVDVFAFSYGGYRLNLTDAEAGSDPPSDWAMFPPWILSYGRDGLPFYETGIEASGDASEPTSVPLIQSQVQATYDGYRRTYPIHADLYEFTEHAKFAQETRPCLVRNLLQGLEFSTARNVPVFSDCYVTLGGVDPLRLSDVTKTDRERLRQTEVHPRGDASSTFRAVAFQRLGDVDRLVLEGRIGDLKTQVWFGEDVPYPIQVSASASEGARHVLRLVAFTAGGAPLHAMPDGPAPMTPALAFAPSRVWGPDDTGFDTPVNATMAWNAALQDGWLASYLEAHPHAIAYFVHGAVKETSEKTRTQTWRFWLTDDGTEFRVEVAADTTPIVRKPPLLELPQLPTDESTDGLRPPPSFTFHYPEASTKAPRINQSLLPAELPTALSLISRWQAYHPDDVLSDLLWGVRVACLVPQSYSTDGCAPGAWDYRLAVTGETDASTLEPQLAPEPNLQSSMHYGWHESSWDRFGAPVEFTDLRSTYGGSFAAGGPLAPESDSYSPPATPTQGWQMPEFRTVSGIGAAAAFLGLAYLLWPMAKGGALSLYARVAGDEVLRQPQRARLYGLVEARPGIHLKELGRQSGLAWGQTQHHMQKLVTAGLVIARASGGYTCYFPRGQDRHAMAAAGAIKAPGARRLLACVSAATGRSVSELSRKASMTDSTAHYHLKRLEAAGLVSTQLVNGSRLVRLTELGGEVSSRQGLKAAAA